MKSQYLKPGVKVRVIEGHYFSGTKGVVHEVNGSMVIMTMEGYPPWVRMGFPGYLLEVVSE